MSKRLKLKRETQETLKTMTIKLLEMKKTMSAMENTLKIVLTAGDTLQKKRLT